MEKGGTKSNFPLQDSPLSSTMSFHYDSHQAAKFEAKLKTIQAQSVKVSDALLVKLAAKRDSYLASIR